MVINGSKLRQVNCKLIGGSFDVSDIKLSWKCSHKESLKPCACSCPHRKGSFILVRSLKLSPRSVNLGEYLFRKLASRGALQLHDIGWLCHVQDSLYSHIFWLLAMYRESCTKQTDLRNFFTTLHLSSTLACVVLSSTSTQVLC